MSSQSLNSGTLSQQLGSVWLPNEEEPKQRIKKKRQTYGTKSSNPHRHLDCACRPAGSDGVAALPTGGRAAAFLLLAGSHCQRSRVGSASAAPAFAPEDCRNAAVNQEERERLLQEFLNDYFDPQRANHNNINTDTESRMTGGLSLHGQSAVT